MRFSTTQPPFSCGLDLHARTMDVCLLDQRGEGLVHRHRQTAPELFLHAMAPYRPGIVGAVAGMGTWDWLADLWADDGSPCVLGQALSMPALHGGKAKHDRIDSHKRAALLRGGRRPPAEGSPAPRRATRALLRRRLPLAPQRAALLAPVHNTHRPYHLPAIGTTIADTAHRDGVAARCAEAAVHKSIEGDRALLTDDDAWLRAVARPLLNTAQHQDANTLSLRHTGPGIGQMLRLVLLSEIPQSPRVPRVQDGVAACRLVTWAPSSAGQRLGTSGATIGQAHLQWACSAAAVWCLSAHPAPQPSLARLEQQPDQGKACTMLAHKLARAV